jgi:replicative DNA helicase
VSRAEASALQGQRVTLPDGTVIEAMSPSVEVLAACSAARRKVKASAERGSIAKPLSAFRSDAIAEAQEGGLPFGLRRLDELLRGGLKPGELCVVGGRPGMGKTAFLLHAVKQWARQGEPGIVFSLEMTGSQLYRRLLTDASDTDRDDWGGNPDRVEGAADMLDEWGVFVADGSNLSVAAIRGECERRASDGTLGWIMVDYLTIMQVPAGDYRLAIGENVRGLASIAKDYSIPVILAAQLSRDLEKRGDKRPIPADLRESGQIEQEAQVILFLYRDVVYNPATADPGEVEILVRKNRDGREGEALARWEGDRTRFVDPIDSDDVRL